MHVNYHRNTRNRLLDARKKRLEAVRLFGVFHDFSCMAEQVTDILDPVLEIARMQKASAGDQGMHVGNHWTG